MGVEFESEEARHGTSGVHPDLGRALLIDTADDGSLGDISTLVGGVDGERRHMDYGYLMAALVGTPFDASLNRLDLVGESELGLHEPATHPAGEDQCREYVAHLTLWLASANSSSSADGV